MPRLPLALAFAMTGFALAAPLAGAALPLFGTSSAYAQQASVSFSVFFDKLSDGGHWVRHPHYSYVFCPDVDARWSPYTNGHWVYLADRGWYFDSDEPYAWAVYHYGRWFQDSDLGWCWVPGNVWAPAWVSWRHSPDYIGWAPLEPEGDGFVVGDRISAAEPPRQNWVFVPVVGFVEPELQASVVFGRDKPDVYDRTQSAGTVVVKNNIVVNTVININIIEDATKKPVPTVKPQPVNDPGQLKGGAATGGTIAVFDPKLDAPKKDEAPKQAEDTTQAAQQHKDKAGNPPADGGKPGTAPASGATTPTPPAPATTPANGTPAPADASKPATPDANAPKPADGKPAADCAKQDVVDGVCPPKGKGKAPANGGSTAASPSTPTDQTPAKPADSSTPAATPPAASAPADNATGKPGSTKKPARAQDCPDGKLVNGVCEPVAQHGKPTATDQKPASAPAATAPAPADTTAPAAGNKPNADAPSNAAPKASNGKGRLRCPPGQQEENGACVPKAGAKGDAGQSQ